MASSELRSRRRRAEEARGGGEPPPAAISASWRRCAPVVEADRAAAPVDAEPDDVAARWDASPIRRSGVGVEEQLTRAAEAGDLVAAVTDEEGRILWSAGGRHMRRVAEQVGFVPGGRWDEPSAGTNALALALLTGRPSTVVASEHWCEAVHDWACWSVPVHDRTGATLGVLDLSGRWDRATPVAEMAVAAVARLVEEHLPEPDEPAAPVLDLRLLGPAEARLGGRRLALSPRQVELLAALAIEGPSSLDRLRTLVYGERRVSATTVKAELSHLRRLLGPGAIGSRPYRLDVPVRLDVVDLRDRLHHGDVGAAAEHYAGQLLPDSEAPFAVDHRHVVDVALRRSLLDATDVEALLRFAAVHPHDEAVLEHAVAVLPATDPRRHELRALLDLARRG